MNSPDSNTQTADILSAANPYQDIVKLKHKSFLKQRKLMEPYASWIHIWGFVTGAVISGEFSGFNFGYGYGLGSMIIAHTFSSILMIAVSLNLVELTTAMPFTSWMRLVVFWFCSVAVCWILNIHPKIFFNTITILSVISVILLVSPLLATAQYFDSSKAWETLMPDGSVSTEFLPFGITGVIQSFPLALYLLICFESVPVAVEETIENDGHTMKWGMLAANLTLILLSWIALIVCAGMPPGALVVASATLPYSAILQAVYPDASPQALNLTSIPPIFASQLAIFYACSRYFYGLSRSGYFPQFCSLTNRYGAPWIAMILTLVLWISFSFLLQFFPVFLAIGTIFALIAYMIQPGSLHPAPNNHATTTSASLKCPQSFGFASAAINFLIASCGAGLECLWFNSKYGEFVFLGIMAAFLVLVPFYYFNYSTQFIIMVGNSSITQQDKIISQSEEETKERASVMAGAKDRKSFSGTPTSAPLRKPTHCK
ncbi:hypothetical protein BDR26DRAFT_858094 [Obelidium mucronatum]|nr:hypothetical protein BDR26DRAFT_858094 [Obelidium mucronatum]